MEQNELDACFNFINVPLVAIAIQKHEDRQLEKTRNMWPIVQQCRDEEWRLWAFTAKKSQYLDQF